MNEIKFRALDQKNEWQYGYYEEILVGIGKTKGIIHKFCDWNLNMDIEVNTKTVCQYTGLKDKNGKKIYEGDLFKSDSLIEPKFEIVEWDNYSACFEPFGNDYYSQSPNLGEVIGNIYENPELIKE